MSKITVNLGQPESEKPKGVSTTNSPFSSAPAFSKPSTDEAGPKKKRSILVKVLLALVVLVLLGGGALAIGGYFYWGSLQKSPGYSLGLLVDAARNDKKEEVEKYVDTDSVMNDFMPQIVDKAKERYARGFPPAQVKQAEQRAQNLIQQALPIIKERAKTEIPRLIKEKTQSLPSSLSSPWMVAFGLGRLATIEQAGDTATVKAKVNSEDVELKMQKNGDRWKIVGVKDDALADKIATDVAQKIQVLLTQKPTGGKNPNPKNPNADKDILEQLKQQLQQLAP